jgi:hypothetical protein
MKPQKLERPRATLVGHHVARFAAAAVLATAFSLGALFAQAPSTYAQQKVEAQA